MAYGELLETIVNERRAHQEAAAMRATKIAARVKRRVPQPAPAFPCPKCGVPSGMPCRSRKGNPCSEPHAVRLAPLARATEPKDAGKRRRGLKVDTLRS